MEQSSGDNHKILQLRDRLLDWLHSVLLGYHMMRVCCDNKSSTTTTEAVWLGLNGGAAALYLMARPVFPLLDTL